MTEKIIGTKKNGMAMMLLLVAATIASAAGFVGSVFLIEGQFPTIGIILLIRRFGLYRLPKGTFVALWWTVLVKLLVNGSGSAYVA